MCVRGQAALDHVFLVRFAAGFIVVGVQGAVHRTTATHRPQRISTLPESGAPTRCCDCSTAGASASGLQSDAIDIRLRRTASSLAGSH